MRGAEQPPSARAALPAVRHQYAASARRGLNWVSCLAGRGNIQSATPRIIIITKPTRIAWVWALIRHGVAHTPASHYAEQHSGSLPLAAVFGDAYRAGCGPQISAA